MSAILTAECSAMKLQNTWGRNSVIIYVQLIDLAFYVKLNLFINNLILLIININNFSPVLLQTALCLFCEEKILKGLGPVKPSNSPQRAYYFCTTFFLHIKFCIKSHHSKPKILDYLEPYRCMNIYELILLNMNDTKTYKLIVFCWIYTQMLF